MFINSIVLMTIELSLYLVTVLQWRGWGGGVLFGLAQDPRLQFLEPAGVGAIGDYPFRVQMCRALGLRSQPFMSNPS